MKDFELGNTQGNASTANETHTCRGTMSHGLRCVLLTGTRHSRTAGLPGTKQGCEIESGQVNF